MNYTLNQLQVYIKVVQTKSITKAAEELFLTQPAVSIQLKNFQDQFDIPLYQIIGRKLQITDFGMEIFKMVEKIMEQVYAINYKTEAFKGLLSGKLSIASVSTGKYIIPYFLNGFLQQHQGIDLNIDVTNKQKVVKSLESGEVDFALVSVTPDQIKIEEELLFENHLFLIGNKESNLDKQKNKLDILKNIPLIYREEGSATRTIMESFLEKSELKIRKRLELTSNEAVKQAVIAGLGYSIMPLIGNQNELQSGDLKIIPTEGFPITSKWRLIWLTDNKLSPVATELLSFIQKEKNNIYKKYFSWKEKYIK